jgi:hypothetical protein
MMTKQAKLYHKRKKLGLCVRCGAKRHRRYSNHCLAHAIISRRRGRIYAAKYRGLDNPYNPWEDSRKGRPPFVLEYQT